MKIQILQENVVVPEQPMFYAGTTYEVGDELANTLIERMQAVPVQPESRQEEKVQDEPAEKPDKKSKRQASN